MAFRDHGPTGIRPGLFKQAIRHHNCCETRDGFQDAVQRAIRMPHETLRHSVHGTWMAMPFYAGFKRQRMSH